MKYNKSQQETIARLKYHAATCFYQFIPPFEKLSAWQEIGQQPDMARPKQGEVWGPENQYERVKIIRICSLLLDSMCVGMSSSSASLLASEWHRGLHIQTLNIGRGDTQMCHIVRGFACGSGVP